MHLEHRKTLAALQALCTGLYVNLFSDIVPPAGRESWKLLDYLIGCAPETRRLSGY